jgi:glutathione S-transferase
MESIGSLEVRKCIKSLISLTKIHFLDCYTIADIATWPWLYALYERDSGNSGGQTESKVVYDYWKKCKDVPGFGFLYNNDLD